MRTMRSDHLERHRKIHENHDGEEESQQSSDNLDSSSALKNIVIHNDKIKNRNENETSTSMDGNITIQEKEQYLNHVKFDKDGLRKTLKRCNGEYKEKINLGATIYQILGVEDIDEESIPPIYKEALDLFVKRKQYINQQNVILRPWQEDLMKIMENPTDREVIWVKGANGCEGKSWFQEYIESKFGWNRVVNGMDIKTKNSSICHALGKRPLTTTDIFLFNVGKAKTFEGVNYEVLEKIKDGKLLASKYDSKELRIRTPNVVVVFSNDSPNVGELAVDRWRIFSIKENKLVDMALQAPKPKRQRTTTDEYGRKTEYVY